MPTIEETKEEKEEAFEVGDRVILGGLKNAEHLNGMHGTVSVATTRAELAEGCRYGVDLDLVLPGKGRLSIKPSNLAREPPIPAGSKRAAVAGGSLVEEEGLPCSYCLSYVEYVVALEFAPQDDIRSMEDLNRMSERGGTLEALRLNQLLASGWTYWNEGVYTSVREKVRETIPNVNGGLEVNPTYRTVHDAVDDYSAVKGWNVRITGNFWICGIDEAGAYLIPEANSGHVYQCASRKEPFWTPLPLRYPVMMRVTMIPWYGRLVSDGLLMPPDGHPDRIIAPANKSRELKEAVEAAKREGRVVSRLAQLEVPGGSLKGVHDLVAKESATSSQQQEAKNTPTAEEQKLLKKIANFPVEVDDSWLFCRNGYTEYENPNHRGSVFVNGTPLGVFECSALIPTSLDILNALMSTVRRIGKRPGTVGIDDPACCDRVQALLKGHNVVSDTEALYYAPPTSEEIAAATALADFQQRQQRM